MKYICPKLDKFDEIHKEYRVELRDAEYHEVWILRPAGEICCGILLPDHDCDHKSYDIDSDGWILGFKEARADRWFASHIIGKGRDNLHKVMRKLYELKPLFKKKATQIGGESNLFTIEI